MNLIVPQAALARAVDLALDEDLHATGDMTTEATIPPGTSITAVIRSRETGRIAGIDSISHAFARFPEPATITIVAGDGADIAPGDVIASLTGSARTILSAERTILNILCRLSGIATATAHAVRLAAGYKAVIKDTRKTTPGLRALEKYAIAIGGGINHRFGLHDAVLIKDNHIAIAGSITAAITRARARLGDSMPIQVEVETLAELEEALRARVGAVLLDNFPPDGLRCAVALANGRCHTEASGGITLANVREYAATGVDAISLGWLTHSARALDLGLDVTPAG